jgi:acetyl-CoA carboxylase carboxyltransferase component
LLTRKEIINIAGRADESEGDILHPNCKCEITIWDKNSKIPKSPLTEAEKEETSQIRQKVNGLTLEKERVKTKMKIAEEYGYMDEYDKYNQQRNKINKSIRDLKEQLPTKELKKQVTVINR